MERELRLEKRVVWYDVDDEDEDVNERNVWNWEVNIEKKEWRNGLCFEGRFGVNIVLMCSYVVSNAFICDEIELVELLAMILNDKLDDIV